MNEKLIRTWQLKTVYTVPVVICTTCIIPNNLHRTSKLLTLHPALYSLMQKAVIINTRHIVRISDRTVNNKYLAG